jgi:hypothetical protein
LYVGVRDSFSEKWALKQRHEGEGKTHMDGGGKWQRCSHAPLHVQRCSMYKGPEEGPEEPQKPVCLGRVRQSNMKGEA